MRPPLPRIQRKRSYGRSGDGAAAALAQLSTAEQALFYRKYYYLQPTSQIASELGTTERAVEGRLYRLKKRLRGMLGGELDG